MCPGVYCLSLHPCSSEEEEETERLSCDSHSAEIVREGPLLPDVSAMRDRHWSSARPGRSRRSRQKKKKNTVEKAERSLKTPDESNHYLPRMRPAATEHHSWLRIGRRPVRKIKKKKKREISVRINAEAGWE